MYIQAIAAAHQMTQYRLIVSGDNQEHAHADICSENMQTMRDSFFSAAVVSGHYIHSFSVILNVIRAKS